MEKILNFIGGEFVQPTQNRFIENIDPSSGEVYNLIPDSDQDDVLKAISAADKAFPIWSQKETSERAFILRKISSGILENLEALAQAETKDNGKPIQLSKTMDIPRSAKNFDFFADLLTQFHGDSFQSNATTLNYTQYSPLGVVACISPWNLPLYLFTWKIAPALAAGNTIVAKPSELTPMTAYLLAKIIANSGLPHGVLNIVHGTGAKVGNALTQNSKVKAITFTGSTQTGKLISKTAAETFKKVALEMGGKNPTIIFADAHFENAVNSAVNSSFRNQGQICLCGSRILVEESIYLKFKNAFIEKVSKLKVGNPFDTNTDQGALVSKAHLEKVLSYIELAKQEGGKILVGGTRVQLEGTLKNGYYLSPTVIENLPMNCRTNQEEIFGPVVTLTSFKDESDAIELANSTNYGLAASVWTENINKSQRLSQKLEFGIVWVNTWMNRDLRTPFGGVKDSGFGREGGMEALKFFSEIKNICIQHSI